MTTLTLQRLSAAVGAEVIGVDTDRLASDDSVAAAVIDALEVNGVLVFRGLYLEPEAQVAFCRKLGEIDLTPGHHDVAGIYRVTLDKSRNSKADYLKGTFDWHIDGCTPVNVGDPPQMATVLSAVAVAASGGETEFASTYAAYERLSDEDKTTLGALRVMHTLEASQRRANPNPSEQDTDRWRKYPGSTHPLVWTHRDGRRSLVLGTSADYVIDMDVETGRALLTEQLDRATEPGFVYRHQWSVGDTVIWDNRGVLHRATPYAADSPREMLRTTVLGDEHIQ
jgi:alpha-ketoglutarate-dependent taurine dioxygenase